MLMPVSEYAAHREIGVQAIQFAIARGRIRVTDDNLIDSDAADAAWEEGGVPAQARPGPKPVHVKREPFQRSVEAVPGITYTDARALREVYEVQRKQLELEVRRGTLVDREQVEREAFTQFRMLRDAAFNLPPRLAAQLASESDPVKVEELLEAELRRVFEDFANGGPV